MHTGGSVMCPLGAFIRRGFGDAFGVVEVRALPEPAEFVCHAQLTRNPGPRDLFISGGGAIWARRQSLMKDDTLPRRLVMMTPSNSGVRCLTPTAPRGGLQSESLRNRGRLRSSSLVGRIEGDKGRPSAVRRWPVAAMSVDRGKCRRSFHPPDNRRNPKFTFLICIPGTSIMQQSDKPSLVELKRETEQNRERASPRRLNSYEVAFRTQPPIYANGSALKSIKAEVSDYVRSRGERLVEDMTAAARRNPMQAVAVGAGVAYPLLRLARAIPMPVLMVGAGLFFAGSKTGQSAVQKASDMASDLSDEVRRRGHDHF